MAKQINMKNHLPHFKTILTVIVLPILLTACNKPATPVDVFKLPPIPENELKVIKDYIKMANEMYASSNKYSDSQKSYVFDQKNRFIIRTEKHLKLSTEGDFKDYIEKKYNNEFKINAITSICEGRQSRVQAKAELKNHISTKYIEQDKNGKEFYNWTISPSEHCQSELKKLDIQYPQ